jgi:hypothetical protein
MPTLEPEPGTLFQYGLPADNQPAIAREIRDAFKAIARTHYTSDSDFPAYPQNGQPRINAEDPNNTKLQFWLPGTGGGSQWRDAISFLNLGLGTPSKQVVAVTTPATVWTIDHNIGSFVHAFAFDSSGYAFQPVGPPPMLIGSGQVQIQQVNVNRVVFTFSGATAGFAVIIG